MSTHAVTPHPSCPTASTENAKPHVHPSSRLSRRQRTLDKQIEEIRAAFASAAGADRLIDEEEFQKALGIKDQPMAGRLFSLFDHNNDGAIGQQEFLTSVEQLVLGDDEAKLKFAFDLHDGNRNGAIDERETRQIIASGLVENQLDFEEQQVNELTGALFREADVNKDGDITFEEFKAVLAKHPALVRSMTVSPVAWLRPRQREIFKAIESAAHPQQPERRWGHYLQNNWAMLLFLALYVGINVFLFVSAAMTHAAQGDNVFVQIARGCGAMLNFNGALILVPMMRHLLTWLRKSPVNNLVPIDKSIEFHKLIGQVMFAAAIVHTVAHLINYATLDNPYLANLFATRAGLTGLPLLIVFGVIWWTSQTRIRMNGHFRLFYLAHMGYALWLALLLFHGPHFWQWAWVAILGFAVERIWRFLRAQEPAHIVNVRLWPNKVLGLELERPEDFDYRPGDYVYVRCPEISRYEWHPFTISSAPEDKQTLTIDIRSVGSWTGAIYRRFERKREAHLAANDNGNSNGAGESDEVRLPLYLDGPYGTPSTHIFESEAAILVGAGIGATPFASILKSIAHRKRRGDVNLNLKKVYFYWVNREQRAFEWFVDVLSKIEAEDTEGFIDINVYLTCVQKESDMKSRTLFIAMDLLHAESQVDLITGLQTRTGRGRPDWDKIFQAIADEHDPVKPDVYFCGPPGLSKILKQTAEKFEFGYRKENF